MKQSLLCNISLLGLAWSVSFLPSILSAEEADKPTAVSDADSKEEPVETLQKKTDKPEAAKPAEPPAADKTAAPDKAEPAAKPKANLSDQLLEGLGLQGDAASGNPLDAIVERMRDVQQRLQKTETDQQTRDQQTRIVKDLDDLIEKLKNQKPPPQNPNQNQPPPPPMGDPPPSDTPPRGGTQPKPQNSQKQRSGSEQQKSQEQQKREQKQQQSAAQQQTKGKAQDSENQLRQGRSVEEEAARQRMAKDVWGHLPAALRQELLNVYSEKFLPKYDDMVRKYYEALAEQNRQNP